MRTSKALQRKPKAPGVGLQTTAAMGACFLSGAMMSISAVTVPAVLDTSIASSHLLHQWARIYYYGHIIMPTIGVSVTSLYAFLGLRKRVSNHRAWLIYGMAGATTITMVPFTWLVMAPTNNALFQLLDMSEVDLGTVQELIVKWACLHLIRSLFPLVGSLLGLVGVRRELCTPFSP